MNEKIINKIGWFGSVIAIAMWFSYIDQIRLNIAGQKGSIILPIVTAINCTIWSFYAWFKTERDLPLFVCNIPGIVLGAITAVTAII